jgi:protein-S-isoprenylcysteine O-methyltransferase Ste14
MHRFFAYLAIGAAALGLWLLFGTPQQTDVIAQHLEGTSSNYSGWAIGLVVGLTLAWLAGIEWRELPARVGTWVRVQRRRAGLIVLGGLFASILLLF